MDLSARIVTELNNESFVFDKEICSEFQIKLNSGWVDFELKMCGDSVEPLNIRVWDNEGAEVLCKESELDIIYKIIIKNTEIC